MIDMPYYEIAVGKNQATLPFLLTYSSEELLDQGQIVTVPLRRQLALGIVINESSSYIEKQKIKNITGAFPYKLPEESIELLKWLQVFYPFSVGATTLHFLPSPLNRDYQISDQPNTLDTAIELNDSQLSVVKNVTNSLAKTILLHGETGSGKTRIYLTLAKETLENHKSALLLVPEIGLSSQLWEEARKIFGDKAVFYHSDLTNKEKWQVWSRVQKGENLLIIGPRSCLFLPFHYLGTVIIDEAHESAYKQQQNPRYDARIVAAKLASIYNCKLLLGSATPRLQEIYAIERSGEVLSLKGAATAKTTRREINIVDTTDTNNFTKSRILSNSLVHAIKEALAAGKQSLILLNKRGTARFIQCSNCKWVAACSKCSSALTYHHDSYSTVCHICEKKQPVPVLCPECGSHDLTFKSPGTKAVTEEVLTLFPTARVRRFDSDNKKADKLASHMSDIISGKVDILIGTQLIAKGLDVPNLSVVGILSAESSLLFPDFSSEERSYHMLHQVIGRVARGHIDGKVIIQTSQVDNPVISFAIKGSWDEFISREKKIRQQFLYPPYVHMGRVWLKRKSTASAESAIQKLRSSLENCPGISVSAAHPSFHEKENDYFAWQIILRSKKRSGLLSALHALPAGDWQYDIDIDTLL